MAAIGGDLSSIFGGIKPRSSYELENPSIAVIETHLHCGHNFLCTVEAVTYSAVTILPVLAGKLLSCSDFLFLLPLSDLGVLYFLPRQ